METKKSHQRFTQEFTVEAVKQVTEKGFAPAEVAVRPGEEHAGPNHDRKGDDCRPESASIPVRQAKDRVSRQLPS